jgi:S-DNA-T family DNA segregation ATPase FtsK/SpoIIIE
VDVITGLIKSNLPARIAFQVASRTDSRVVLDEMGADKLLGNGDMLFLWPGTSTLLRGQGTYVDDDEINAVVDVCSETEQQFVKELVQLKTAKPAEAGAAGAPRAGSRDELYDGAVEVVVREGRGSVSLLQRALGIGYGRAARLIDYMAEDGIVGEYNGSQAREVLITMEQWTDMQGGGTAAPPEPPAAKPRRSHRVLTMAPRSEPTIDDEELEDELDEEEVDEGETDELEDAPFADEEDAEEEYDEEDADDEEEYEEDEYEEDEDEEDEYEQDEAAVDEVEAPAAEHPRIGNKRESA